MFQGGGGITGPAFAEPGQSVTVQVPANHSSVTVKVSGQSGPGEVVAVDASGKATISVPSGTAGQVLIIRVNGSVPGISTSIPIISQFL